MRADLAGWALSPASYNRRIGLLLACPVANQAKGYPFEVALPPGLPVAGVILSDQVRTLNWRAQRATPIGRLPDDVMAQVLGRLEALLFG